MKTTISILALCVSLSLAGAAAAQDAPTGGPAAKANAPLKHRHSVNDGTARPGANSFTENQARQHILNSGYSSVSGLTKGDDGIWRGAAVKDGVSRNVALDFKGNVSEATPTQQQAESPAMPTAGSTSTSGRHRHHHWRMRHRWGPHRLGARCGTPGPNGVACSGADRNGDGVADRNERH